jgi:hypothetical protein
MKQKQIWTFDRTSFKPKNCAEMAEVDLEEPETAEEAINSS